MVSKEFLRNLIRKRTNLAYKIFLYIGTHQNGEITFQTQLNDHFNLPYTTLNYHITKFKQEGLILDNFKLSENGKKLFVYLWQNAGVKQLRAHNIQIKFNLLRCPEDYIKRYSSTIFSPFTNGKYKGLRGQTLGITFMIYSTKKIVCVLRNIYANNDEEISCAVQIIINDLKAELERLFSGVTIENYELAKIQTSHIAVLDSVISEKFDLNGFTYEGREIAIDKSHGIYEIEATNPKTALKNIEKLLNMEDALKYNLINKDP